MKSALIGTWNAKHRKPDDLVFSTRKGGPLGRRNLLRHIKAAAAKLSLSKTVDFQSFRTMHSSLMLREGARPEVVRDNMGHANIDVTQNVYGKSWWEERVDAVTRAVDAVSAATQKQKDQPEQAARALLHGVYNADIYQPYLRVSGMCWKRYCAIGPIDAMSEEG